MTASKPKTSTASGVPDTSLQIFTVPIDGAPDRWTVLREEIQQERAAQDEMAAEHAERGRDAQSVSCYGRVKALDWALATMDRMEAGQ